MKGNKKLLVLAVLVLLLSVVFSTYAIYRSSTTATGTVNAAAWSVKVNGTNIESANYTFTAADLTCGTGVNRVGQANTIAPGDVCYIEIPVDATGSQVDVVLEAALGSATLPTGFTASVANASTTIAYDASSMQANVRINIEWTGTLADETSKDTSDKAAAASSLTIPVTLTARQRVAGE